MKIILTGSNGFLGNIFLKHLAINNNVQTLNRNNSTYNCNLAYEIPNLDSDIEIVIHSAGLAHLHKSDNYIFLLNNVIATENLLKSLEKCTKVKKFIFISSVSVYGTDYGEKITEDSPLLANDPYGKSKIKAENIIIEWCSRNDILYTILRLPLVIGDNPPGNLKNMIKGLKQGFYFNIGSGAAKKSMVVADDVAKILLKPINHSIILNLTDGYDPSFYELSLAISKKYAYNKPKSIPYFFAKLFSLIGDYFGTNFILNSKKFNKINSTLTFSNLKAKNILDWKPTKVLDYYN
jgi:nucleoside-diphosphate-sugar epimerase